MKEIIVDIETLSTKSNACVLTLGAILFDRNDNKKYDLEYLNKNNKTFYIRIKKESCDNLSLDVSKDTLDWWKRQPKESRYEVFDHPDRIDIKDALILLSKFASGCEVFWSQGAFDYIILENIYKILDINVPWKFWQIRDSRTLFDVCNINIKNINSEGLHNALSDCYRQYLGKIEAFKAIK